MGSVVMMFHSLHIPRLSIFLAATAIQAVHHMPDVCTPFLIALWISSTIFLAASQHDIHALA